MVGLEIAAFIVVVAFLLLLIFWLRQVRKPLAVRKLPGNPILTPIESHGWESEAVFNPAAYFDGTTVHLLYRALGRDGVSRFGYAWSTDGINFERLPEPVFSPEGIQDNQILHHRSFTSPARYDTGHWASGGGWGGSEDPRMVCIGGRVHVTFNIFNGWYAMRVGLLSIDEEDFKNRRWNWNFNYLSAPGRHKNWVLFPEKIGGQYGIFHNLFHEDEARVQVAYAEQIELPTHLPPFESPDPHALPDRQVAWHHRTRSAGAPPLRTPHGWILFYHAMDPKDPSRYKVGVMLLDLEDPTRVLYRAQNPVLEPGEWYENDWKPGIVYASGAVIVGEDLFIYYGGGDKRIAAAKINLRDFLRKLMTDEHKVQ